MPLLHPALGRTREVEVWVSSSAQAVGAKNLRNPASFISGCKYIFYKDE